MNATIELRGRLIEVDCLWRECRVIAEIDGVAPHSGRRFYTDRTRDRHLRVDRWTVIRITAYDLEHDRAGLAADLRALLG
jgi:very-short-patch-repair endonuclease